MPKVCTNNRAQQSPVKCVTILAILVFAIVSMAQEGNMLRSILPIKAPVVFENKIIYTFDFLFKECPVENWWYYDSSESQMVIVFYDAFINVAENISIEGQMPVKEIEIENIATSIVPSGKKSQIVLHIKKQMHSEVNCFSDTLRVVLWKELESKATVQPRKKLSAIYLLPVILVLITGFLAVTYLPFSSADH